jgi:hypothetical protein
MEVIYCKLTFSKNNNLKIFNSWTFYHLIIINNFILKVKLNSKKSHKYLRSQTKREILLPRKQAVIVTKTFCSLEF